jgi:anti-sigma factor RsiW
MRCERARDILCPPERPQLAGDDVVAAQRHVERCESCRDYMAQDAAWLALLRRVRRVEAPADVRERVFHTLARERTIAESGPTPRRSRNGRFVLAMAAVLALAVGSLMGLNLMLQPRGGPLPLAERQLEAGFVEDFLRRAVQAEHIETSDPSEVARFLARELGVSGTVPVPASSFELTGAEICIVEGVRGAVVLYKRDGEVLYHYLVPGSGGRRAGPSTFPDRPPAPSSQPGFPAVVTWASHGMEQALVADVSQEELLRMAGDLASQG